MSTSHVPIALFRLGKIVATQNALGKLMEPDILTALRRHHAGDWGDLDDHDRQANDDVLSVGGRLCSVYWSGSGLKFWIITEADRSATTVLMPEDY